MELSEPRHQSGSFQALRHHDHRGHQALSLIHICRAYPHKLANAIIAYDLTGKVQNRHRAIDDVLALFEVLKAMAPSL